MLPSKKILILLAILIVGISTLAWYEYSRGSSTDYTNEPDQNTLTIATSTIDATTSQIDSDHDGLPDWEEALYGTDPHNPDTDGDGTPDGKEVALGRNPLVKGPDDFLSSQNNSVATSTPAEKLTSTDAFAQDFFAKFINLQQSGTQVTSDNASQIASDYLKTATLPSISAKQYTQEDIHLTDSDQTHLTNYHNMLTAIFAKDWPKPKENEFSIMQQALANNDTKYLNNLTPIISAYQNILNDILSVSVPKLAISVHLNVINSLATYIQTLKMIQLTSTDPLSGLVGVNAFQNNYSNFSVSLTNLQVYFINSLK